MSSRIALFTGSFDPFTIGHADIVRRGLELFDEVVVCIGYNVHKQSSEPVEVRKAAIERCFAHEPRVRVEVYSDLTVDVAARLGAHYILKGVRSVKDFEYESEMGEINRRLSGLETVLLLARPELAYISSSMVRELKAFGKDVSTYLP
jgi:pantetheine-phosphate adenylyltransferase